MGETSYTIKIKFDENGRSSVEIIYHAKGKKFNNYDEFLERIGEALSGHDELYGVK